MPRETPILVIRNEHDRPEHWKRFVAILCFIGFYPEFVRAGTGLWYMWYRGRRWEDGYFLSDLMWLVWSAVLFLCGRALWHDRRSGKRWLCAALILTCLASVANQVAADRANSVNDTIYYSIYFEGFFKWYRTALDLRADWHTVLAITIPWLGMFIAAVWIAYRQDKVRSRIIAPWSIIASVWCLCCFIKALSCLAMLAHSDIWLHDSVLNAFWITMANHFRLVVLIIYAGCLFLGGVLLLRGSSWGRTSALAIAGIAAIAAWADWHHMSDLIHAAFRALKSADAMATMEEVDWWATIWTRHDFLGIFVAPVYLVGPWLLIAVYAWRAPMRMPPDDGTPFPRRFCGNCYYNLHGIDSDRCPECGCVLVASEGE